MGKELRETFVKEIFARQPDMKVLFINLLTNSHWQRELILSELDPTQRETFNLRKQFDDEIILDIEEKYLLEEIVTKLNFKKWSYKVWNTGSRGIHISLHFKNIKNLSAELKDRIRRYIIEEFGTDVKLAKYTQWLALEYTPHFKTGKEKTMMDAINYGDNEIPQDVIDYCKKDIETKKNRIIENKELIKDYEKNDPYLKYVLENTIEHGDRNNVLFKNLAIGLVGSGLNRDAIIPFANNIVANCPGKSVGEFMGWVDKSLSGHLTEYNRSELIQWSVKNGYPVLYKLYDDEELIDLMTAKQLWDEIWKHKIACQPVWKDLCFYNMIGTLIDEKEFDYRIHVIFSSYSSTGKDEGLLIVRDILNRLGHKTRQPSTVTDRTLIGGVNQTTIEFNTKHKLSEDEPLNGTKEWKDPVEKGHLQDTDWMAFGEAEFVFRPGAYNKNLQAILRQAMDKARVVEKGVAGYDIPIKTNTSFVMVTYVMDAIINNILHNGLFQRTLFYNKTLTPDEHKIIRTFITQSRFSEEVENQFNEKKYIAKLLEKLRSMKQWYKENRTNIKYEKGSSDYVNSLWEMSEKKYDEYADGDKEILNSMVRRSSNNLHKLVTLTATYGKSNMVTKQMIKDCFELITVCIDSVKEMIIKQDPHNKIKYSILKKISVGSISKSVAYYELENAFRVKSPNKRVAIIKQLIDGGYLTIFKSGRNDMLALSSRAHEYLSFEDDK